MRGGITSSISPLTKDRRPTEEPRSEKPYLDLFWEGDYFSNGWGCAARQKRTPAAKVGTITIPANSLNGLTLRKRPWYAGGSFLTTKNVGLEAL